MIVKNVRNRPLVSALMQKLLSRDANENVLTSMVVAALACHSAVSANAAGTKRTATAAKRRARPSGEEVLRYSLHQTTKLRQQLHGPCGSKAAQGGQIARRIETSADHDWSIEQVIPKPRFGGVFLYR